MLPVFPIHSPRRRPVLWRPALRPDKTAPRPDEPALRPEKPAPQPEETAPRVLRRALVALVALMGSLASCGFAPEPAPMHFALSQTTRTELAEAPAVQTTIAQSLESLFGSPQDPRYAPLEAWTKAGVDPNRADLAQGKSAAGDSVQLAERREISAAEWAEIRAGNQRAFHRELALIDAGRFDEVSLRSSSPALQARWQGLLSKSGKTLAESAPQVESLRAEARALLENWYPTLRDSSELYRQQCLQCHGVEGGGDGPSSHFLDPKPRDYRLGKFKFTAVKDQARPRREDLLRTLDQGLNGTSMPNFRRLSLSEREGLVDYVRFLAIRGEVETRLVATWKDEQELAPDAATKETLDVWEKWQSAAEKFVAFDGEVPPSTPERIARGDVLYHDATKGNCASCHGAKGEGDGPVAYKMDEHGRRVPAYIDAWGQAILPRNLRQGIYRGGSRPIDVYRRIYAGINGGPMPALGEAKDAQGAPLLSPEDMWCLVHYVRSLCERPEGS
jgi:mono/diheme cytochrome c family protein